MSFQSEPDQSDGVQSTDPPLGRVLKTGWAWLVLGATVGLVVGQALMFVLPKSYTADTAVIVRPVEVLDSVGTSPTGTTEVNLDTEAQLVQSFVVAQSAQSKMGTDESTDKLLSRVDVSVPPNTTILDIKYTAGSPEGARVGAASFAEAYLQQREDSAKSALAERQDTLNNQARTLQSRLGVLTQAVSDALVNSPERLALNTQLRLLQSRLGAVQSSQVALRSTQVAPGEIVSPAELPQTQTSPAPLVVLPSALALGLLGGVMAAWVTRWRRERLVSSRDVVELGQTQVIAVCDPHDGDTARGVHQLVQTLVAGGDDVLLMPAVAKQSSLGPAMVVARQVVRLAGRCSLVVDPQDYRQIDGWNTDGTRIAVRSSDTDDRDWTSGGAPTVFVRRPLKVRKDRPIGGIDFAVVTVRAGATTAAQLRKTVARLENSGVTVRGALLDRGVAGDGPGSTDDEEEDFPLLRHGDPGPRSQPSTLSSAAET